MIALKSFKQALKYFGRFYVFFFGFSCPAQKVPLNIKTVGKKLEKML